MLTSVCGFSAMLFSSFTGFAQLGLFTIVGLLTALAVTRFVLPALLPQQSPFRSATLFAVPLLAISRRRKSARLVVLALTVLAAIALILHKGPYWENELASMSPLSTAQKSLDEQLRRETGAPDVRYFLVIAAADEQNALAASEIAATLLQDLAATGTISGFDYPARWLPSEATQRARQASLPDAATLQASLTQALAGTDFRPDSFAPFLADIAIASKQPLLRRSNLTGTSLALRLDSMLLQGKQGWTALLPLQGVAHPDTLAATIAGFKQPGLLFLDLKTESDRLLTAYLSGALTLSVIGCLAIVALLSVGLRSVRRVAAVCLPLAGSVICTAAVLLMSNGALSVFNLFGLLLVVAVGSNYCLFFERQTPNDPARERMVASLLLANLCTVIGFGILSFSRFPVLHGIGVTVAIGAVLCLWFGAILNEPAASLRCAK
jgi:predicted exporter